MLEDEAICQKIDTTDPREPRLLDSGVPLEALVAYYQGGAEGDVSLVAHDYDLPIEEVEAALRYYRRYPAVIDARITLNNAV